MNDLKIIYVEILSSKIICINQTTITKQLLCQDNGGKRNDNYICCFATTMYLFETFLPI